MSSISLIDVTDLSRYCSAVVEEAKMLNPEVSEHIDDVADVFHMAIEQLFARVQRNPCNEFSDEYMGLLDKINMLKELDNVPTQYAVLN